MILDAFHTGQNAAAWAIAVTLGATSVIAPLGLLGFSVSRLSLPRRVRARMIERRTRGRS